MGTRTATFKQMVVLAAMGLLASGCATSTQLGTEAARSRTERLDQSAAVSDVEPGAAATATTGVGARTASGAVKTGGQVAGGGKTATGGTIKIGIQYPANNPGLAAAFGVNVLTGDVDWKTFIQPIVDEVNRHGGIGGRTVVPVYAATDGSQGTFASQAQAVCSKFTDDEHVFAAIGFVIDASEIACFRSHATPFIGEAVGIGDTNLFAQYRGWYYEPAMIATERLVPGLLEGIAQQGFFGNGAKVGIVRLDDAISGRFEDKLRAGLTARGIPVAASAVLSNPPSASDAGSLFSQAANAILRFRDAGVNRIVPVPSGSAIPFVFMNQSESQGYRPTWALSSLDVPAFMAPNAPKAQLHGTVGVGWLNASDIHYTEVPKGVNANEDLCYALSKRRGDESKRYCDGLFFLRDAMAHAPEVSPAGLLAGVEALGATFQSPWAGPTRFGPGRYDGAAAVKPLHFLDECGCFRYLGTSIPVG